MRMFLTDEQHRKLNQGLKQCPRAQRAAAREWAEQLSIAFGMLENVLNGHARIVGFEDGEPLFQMTESGGKYVEEVLLPQMMKDESER